MATEIKCPHCGADSSELMLQNDEGRGTPALLVCACDARIFTVAGAVVDSVSASAYRSAQADYESQLMSCEEGW